MLKCNSLILVQVHHMLTFHRRQQNHTYNQYLIMPVSFLLPRFPNLFHFQKAWHSPSLYCECLSCTYTVRKDLYFLPCLETVFACPFANWWLSSYSLLGILKFLRRSY